jgi:hypothetical protein
VASAQGWEARSRARLAPSEALGAPRAKMSAPAVVQPRFQRGGVAPADAPAQALAVRARSNSWGTLRLLLAERVRILRSRRLLEQTCRAGEREPANHTSL